MKLSKPVVIGLAFAAGLLIGVAIGLTVTGQKDGNSSDVARFTRGTMGSDVTLEQARAVIADCTQHAYNGYVFVFNPNEAQAASCQNITQSTYNYICTILAGGTNLSAAIFQIKADLNTTVNSMLGSIQATLTAGQIPAFSRYSQEVHKYFITQLGNL